MPIAHSDLRLAMARHRKALTLQPDASPQQNWQRLALAWGSAINDYVRIGEKCGWDVAGPDLELPKLKSLLPELLKAIRAANAQGDEAISQLRRDWPPSHDLCAGLLEGRSQVISQLGILNDGSLLARIGASYEATRCVRILDGHHEWLDDSTLAFGVAPGGTCMAFASLDGITIQAGWEGERLAKLAWPTGAEGLPFGLTLADTERRFEIEALHPFPDRQRVLLTCRTGVYVLAAEGATRLLPEMDELIELAEDDDCQASGEPLAIDLDMVHAAMSPDGQWIAAGHQNSVHVLYDAHLDPVSHIGPHSEYPHHALFAADSSQVALNACHFHNGCTIGVAREFWRGLECDAYAESPAMVSLQDGARIYAAVSHGDGYIVGDAQGYLRAFNHAGEAAWVHYIGSTISSMAIAPNGKLLAVGTYSGALSLIELGSGKRDGWQIGTGDLHERERWLFCQDETKPLRW